MRRPLTLLALSLAATAATAQVNGTQAPTDGNGPTPPASTRTDPMAPQRASGAGTGTGRPALGQTYTDANGPSATGDVTQAQPTAGAPITTVSGAGTPGADDVSAPSTHTRTPDQVQAKAKRRPH